jgi:ATP-dependent protease ClpP protease subunit
MKKRIFGMIVMFLLVSSFCFAEEKEENEVTFTAFGEVTSEMSEKLIALSFDASKINILINSSGGDIDAAMSFYNFAKSEKFKVKTSCLGTASSAAAILFCAGEERLISQRGYIILHRISSEASGISPGVIDAMNDYSRNNYASIISSATKGKLSSKKVLEMMEKETFISGEEAVKNGIATGLIKE